jgi:hypothetical protein
VDRYQASGTAGVVIATCSNSSGRCAKLRGMAWEEVVLGGIGGAIVAGGIGTYTAVYIDHRNARRERKIEQERERAVARLIYSELISAYRTAERALEDHSWPLWRQPLRHDAWDRHAHTVASRLPRDVFELLARTYDQLDTWHNRVARYLSQFPASVTMNLGGALQDERDSTELLDKLKQALEASCRELQPAAFPDGRDIERQQL